MCTAIYVLYFYFLCWYDVIGVSMVGDESSLDPLSVTLLRDEDRWFSCHKYCAKHTDFHNRILFIAFGPQAPTSVQHNSTSIGTYTKNNIYIMAAAWD